mgnify:CR=1 FL=1
MNQAKMRRITEIRRAIQEMSNLPTLPNVALEVMRLTQDPKSTITDLVRVVEKDVALASSILRAANSAYYGVPRKIDTMKMAVVILGMNEIINLVMGVSVFKTFSDTGGSDDFDMNLFWQHSAAVGDLSLALYQGFKLQAPSSCYISGLLHDVGKLILFQFFNDLFMEVLEVSKSDGNLTAEAEIEALGVDHGHIGAWLIQRWNLPEDIVSAVAQHHIRASDVEPDSISVFVDWADRLAHLLDENSPDKVCKILNADKEWKNWIPRGDHSINDLIDTFSEKYENSKNILEIVD